MCEKNIKPAHLTDDQLDGVSGGASIFTSPKADQQNRDLLRERNSANLGNQNETENDRVRGYSSDAVSRPRPRG